MTFDGSGTITGLAAGGLPDGTVQPADLSTGAPVWDTSGNVGIGTSSPSSLLHVSSSTTNSQVTVSNSGSQFQVQSNSNDGFLNMTGTGSIVFRNGSSFAERARIDSSGYFYLGCTATPSASVFGVRLGTNGTNFWISSASVTSSYQHMLFLNTNGTVGSISTSGSATTYSTSSDYRLKHDIAPMQNALATVAQLKPVTYKWNADDSESQGFIAHELQAVVPDCVTGEKDAVDENGNPVYQGIDTSFLVATLTAAIQELNAKVEAQAAEIAALKGAQA
jgi:hypothetical protein